MTDFRNIINDDILTLVYFYDLNDISKSEIIGQLKKIKKKLKSKIKIISIDINENYFLCDKLEIKSTPKFKIFKKQTLIWEQDKIESSEKFINFFNELT
ncbi:MAG: hypothetical protein CBE48_001580 [Flavobacteriales bacterium TMED288]|nr:hypothetical protein [Flavobacteriales bacterium]RPG53521.1 MAG: hypothetical protein CBE48_001580 [Flavobacteriales bacterium TMED288]